VENFTDLYTDYLISSFSYTTATGLASLLSVKHDKITRCLSKGVYDSKFLWKTVKLYIREILQSNETVFLSFDDSIEAKPYSDESELICWHFDHSINRSVKGVNFLSALVQTADMRLPCAVEFVRKNKWETDAKSGKQKRVSDKTKNELFREMLLKCSEQFRFDYVMADSPQDPVGWYASLENMRLIRSLDVQFIMALKSNRKVALSLEAKKAKEYISIESLQPGQQAMEVWLEELDFPLLLTKQVFKDEDDTAGELYLACSDMSLSYEQINTYYKKRWGVEEYHKSVKSNVAFAKSPTKTIKTQINHFVLSIVAYAKLEWLKQRTKLNHFAMKAKIYLAAQQAAYNELKKLSTPNAA
jgi:DDE superfamily endonuclease